MSWKLENMDRLANALLQAAKKDVLNVCSHLGSAHRGRNSRQLSAAVHNSRKRIKKLRVLLRLTHDHLNPGFRHRQNQSWRAIAHALSPLRDTEVQLATLQKLRQHSPKEITDEVFAQAVASFSSPQAEHPLKISATSARALLTKLRTTLAVIQRLPLHDLHAKHLQFGLKRAWKIARAAQKQAEKTVSDDDLHEWRKRAKDFAHQLDVADVSIFKPAGKLVERLVRLGKILGEDHDLVVLETRLRQVGPQAIEKLIKPIQMRRAKLQKRAFKLGAHL